MRGNDVSITGVGCVLPTGVGWQPFWIAAVEGKSAIGRLSNASVSMREDLAFGHVPRHVSEEAESYLPRKSLKFFSSPSVWAAGAACTALEDAGLDMEPDRAGRLAVYVCQGDHTHPSLADFLPSFTGARGRSFPGGFAEKAIAERRFNPFVCMRSLSNNAFSAVALALGHEGFGTSLCHGDGMGFAALQQAVAAIRSGRTDTALVVATGSVDEAVILAELSNRRILAKSGASPSFRPYAAACGGMAPGEGAVALLLESSDRARSRGVRAAPRLAAVAATYSGREGATFTTGCYRDCAARLGDADALAAVGLVIGEGKGIDDVSEAREIAACATAGGLPGARATAVSWVAGVIPAASEIVNVAAGALALRSGVVPSMPYPVAISEGPAWARLTSSLPKDSTVLTATWAFNGFNGLTLLAPNGD